MALNMELLVVFFKILFLCNHTYVTVFRHENIFEWYVTVSLKGGLYI